MFGNNTMLLSLYLEVKNSQTAKLLNQSQSTPLVFSINPVLNSNHVKTIYHTRCRLEKHIAQAAGTFHLFKCFYLKKIKDLHGTTSSQHSYDLVIPITIQLQPINQRWGRLLTLNLKKKGGGEETTSNKIKKC